MSPARDISSFPASDIILMISNLINREKMEEEGLKSWTYKKFYAEHHKKFYQ